MKKGLFKFLVTILIAVISISAVPVSIYAADSDFEIVLNVGGKTGYIQKYNGTDENVVIPSHTRSGVPITAIEMNAFSGNTYIKSITVPDTIKVIEQNAFYGCTNLFSIDLPDSLERIEWRVFNNTAFYNNSNVWFDYTFAEGATINFLYDDSVAPTTEPSEATKTTEVTEATEGTTTSIAPAFTEVTAATAPSDSTKPSEKTDGAYVIGDVNMDGKLNIRGATLLQKYLAKMAEFNEKVLALADMDTNGKVNIKDATYIQKKIANIIK